ncbi:hypothetical protein Tsubulata_051209, partial [Turnera subulata]
YTHSLRNSFTHSEQESSKVKKETQNQNLIARSSILARPSRLGETMGSALSYFLGTAEAAAAEGPPSGNFAGVTAFHSSNRWQLHFNSAKDSPQLEVAQEYMVQGMPTFVLVKRGKEVDRVMGADQNDLERKVLKHRSSE